MDVEARLRGDPVEFAHGFKAPRDQEIVGLLGASLAFGNALAARRSIEKLLAALGPEPSATVQSLELPKMRKRLRGFVHRIYTGDHLAHMLVRAGALQREHGSIGNAFIAHHEQTGGSFRESLARLADDLRGRASSRSARHLISDPRAGSACKRLVLYARWMIRPADGVDLGLWSVPPSDLVMPVDTHIHRISRNLGFTTRRTATWATAEEITAALRKLDPHDPVKYDFALCHLGVSRECPSRRDPEKCASCVLQDVCSVWSAKTRSGLAKKAG
jgi:uncharacterized protein (TIGR02757 family)